ncbi:hypothetical protein KFE98_05510 [bacterium SCSIO 12741]|nr:hypothetical protein KFE98_05510 [bacterium SCSIO 12741]
MKFTLPLIGLFLILSLTSQSQDLELAGIRYFNYPSSSTRPHNDQYSIQETGGFFNLPTRLKNQKTILINGIAYGLVHVDYQQNSLLPEAGKINLHTASYNFSIIQKLPKKWIIMASFVPTLASNLKGSLSTDDFVIQTMAFALKEVGPNLKLGGGLAYTTRLGEPLVVPVVPLFLKSKKHRINAILPIKFMYAYRFKPNLDIGFKAVVNGGNFNITDISYHDIEINKFHYTRANLGPIIHFRPRKLITLELTGGISTGRNSRLLDLNDQTFTNSSTTAAFISVGFIIKPSLD